MTMPEKTVLHHVVRPSQRVRWVQAATIMSEKTCAAKIDVVRVLLLCVKMIDSVEGERSCNNTRIESDFPLTIGLYLLSNLDTIIPWLRGRDLVLCNLGLRGRIRIVPNPELFWSRGHRLGTFCPWLLWHFFWKMLKGEFAKGVADGGHQIG